MAKKKNANRKNSKAKKVGMKRAIKDSVFTFLFGQPEYRLQLYQALHPEDKETTETDLESVTLRRIISTGIYNDLGFRVGDKLMVLSEAQSTFSVNICLRLLLYLAPTYQKYVREKKLDLYATTPVKIPRPELYMIYSGKENVPEYLHLSDLYEGEGKVDVDLTVKVLRRDGSRSIIDQYLRFCEIADEQREKYGYTQKSIEETIRLCIEEGVLTAFLESRRQEVISIMDSLFNEDEIAKLHDDNIKIASIVQTVKRFMEKFNLSDDEALEIAGIPERNWHEYKMRIQM